MAKQKEKITSNTKLIVIGIVALVIGTGAGYSLAEIEDGPRDHDDAMKMQHQTANSDAMTMAGHDHEIYNIDSQDAPTVSLDVQKDSKSGYNVHVETTNFDFTPDQAGMENYDGEGHAHLYVNGEKIARMYGEWYHIPVLNPGENVITVTLNTNNHMIYAIDDKPIEASQTVTVTEEEHNETPHDH